jgi:serine protease
VAGVNWSTRVQAVRVLGKCGGTIEDINDAVRWAAGLPVPGVPANATPARVVNLSLGGSGPCSASPSTQRAIDDAVAAGTTVVVAAGNDAADASGFLPASCEGVITVAASDGRGRLVQRYSNFGATVEIMAPGGDVERDDDGDGNEDGVYSMVRGGYAYYNGTSMATPHVAGVAALVLAADPGATPAQVLARIQQIAIPRTSAECPRPCGAGLLNAFAGFVSIAFTPPEVRLDGAGQSADLTATVKRGDAPVTGATVALRSDNPAVATVDPPSAVTDGAGQVRVQVRAQSNGRTSVQAETQGGSSAAPVRVPGLSDAALVVLAGLVIVLYRRRARGRA